MIQKERLQSIFLLTLLISFPITLQADAGGPLLLMINVETFLIGSLWIIIVEYLYLRRKYIKISKSKILDITIKMNFFSSLVGAIVIPIFVMITTGIVGTAVSRYSIDWADAIGMLGTFVVGKFVPQLSVTSTYFYFPITYLITVYFEYHMLRRYLARLGSFNKRDILFQSYIFNGISYFGLAIPFVVFLQRITPNM